MPLISREDGGTVAVQRLFPGDSTPMGAILDPMTHRAGRFGLAIVAAAAIAWPLLTAPAQARGPDGIADVAEAVIDAVVNISTKQTVEMNTTAMPQLPPGSPFEEFFDEFFKNRQGQGGPGGGQTPRRVNSLGSGFIIDASGLGDAGRRCFAGHYPASDPGLAPERKALHRLGAAHSRSD